MFSALANVGFSGLRKAKPETNRETRRTRGFNLPLQMRGITITPDTIVEISAAWACGMLISKVIAASVWQVFNEDADGNRELARSDPLWEILNRTPNPARMDMTSFHFLQSRVFECVLAGDSYAEIERSRAGKAAALHPLMRSRMRPRWDSQGYPYYDHTNPDGTVTRLETKDVFHFRGPTYDGITSYRLWEVAQLMLQYSKATETFGASYFANGAHLGEIFETEKDLTDEQWERLETELEEQHNGPGDANDYLILEAGIKFKTIAQSPEVAQFLQTRQFLVEEVCRFLGVPPHKIAHLLRSTFNNIEEQNIDFVNDTLIPWATPIAKEANLKLVQRGIPTVTRFDFGWVKEGSAVDIAEADSKHAMHGIRSRDEIRRDRGENRRGGNAEKLTVMKQMIDIEDISPEVAGGSNESGFEDIEPGQSSRRRRTKGKTVDRNDDRSDAV